MDPPLLGNGGFHSLTQADEPAVQITVLQEDIMQIPLGRDEAFPPRPRETELAVEKEPVYPSQRRDVLRHLRLRVAKVLDCHDPVVELFGLQELLK